MNIVLICKKTCCIVKHQKTWQNYNYNFFKPIKVFNRLIAHNLFLIIFFFKSNMPEFMHPQSFHKITNKTLL